MIYDTEGIPDNFSIKNFSGRCYGYADESAEGEGYGDDGELNVLPAFFIYN